MSRGRHHLPRGGKHRAVKPKADRKELVEESILGLFDGATSLVGVLAALLLSSASTGTILGTTGGLAVAEAIGMGFGAYLSGTPIAGSTVLGAATALGSFLPAIPIAVFPHVIGFPIGVAIMAVFVVVIAELQEVPRTKAYVQTVVTLLIASVASVAAAVFLGAA